MAETIVRRWSSAGERPRNAQVAVPRGLPERQAGERVRTSEKKEKEMSIISEIEEAQKKEVSQFNVGDTVRVHNRIEEGKRSRVQIFEGTVLKIQGGGSRKTFTVRKESSGIGVEKTWPLYSPNVEKVEVVRHGKVRRAKLNYLRNLSGKKAKVKEQIR